MHGLTSFGHEAGNGGNNGRHCPKRARTVFLFGLDSMKYIRLLADDVMKVTRLRANNPRTLTLEDAKRIHRAAL